MTGARFTCDLSTNVGKCRLLLRDTDEPNFPDGALFSDLEYTAYLDLEGGVVKRAAAAALETLASDEAYVQKAIRILDLQTNGPAVAKSLLERASLLRAQADADDGADEGGLFDIAEMVYPTNVRERVWDQGLRSYG